MWTLVYVRAALVSSPELITQETVTGEGADSVGADGVRATRRGEPGKHFIWILNSKSQSNPNLSLKSPKVKSKLGKSDFGFCHMSWLPRICALVNVKTFPLSSLSYTLQTPETVLVPITAKCVMTTPEMRHILCKCVHSMWNCDPLGLSKSFILTLMKSCNTVTCSPPVWAVTHSAAALVSLSKAKYFSIPRKLVKRIVVTWNAKGWILLLSVLMFSNSDPWWCSPRVHTGNISPQSDSQSQRCRGPGHEDRGAHWSTVSGNNHPEKIKITYSHHFIP